MADGKELNPSPKFPEGKADKKVIEQKLGVSYGELSPNPKLKDGLINKTDEKPNTQVVNPGQVQPQRDLTVDQIIDLIKKYTGGYVPEDELADEVNSIINTSLLNGELKRVLQAKTFGVSDFPLESDIDSQHSTVNEGLLPNGDMEGLTETQINRIVVTLNRIINKGWLKVSTLRALKLTSVIYNANTISITASTVVLDATGVLSGTSYLITLDVANASYSYANVTYTRG